MLVGVGGVVDEIAWTVLRFKVYFAHVFTDNAQRYKYQRTDKPDGEHD